MSTVQMTQFFATKSPRIFDECDRLMDALMRLEAEDRRVYDAAVSADASRGIVEVEVVADGESEAEAEALALDRVKDAVSSVVTVVGTELRMEKKQVAYA